MNMDDGEAAHDAYMQIAQELKEAFEAKLKAKGLTPEQQRYVRDSLNDTFRFWKD
jgi:hypothetical protein